jgi:hypothetical protein
VLKLITGDEIQFQQQVIRFGKAEPRMLHPADYIQTLNSVTGTHNFHILKKKMFIYVNPFIQVLSVLHLLWERLFLMQIRNYVQFKI